MEFEWEWMTTDCPHLDTHLDDELIAFIRHGIVHCPHRLQSLLQTKGTQGFDKIWEIMVAMKNGTQPPYSCIEMGISMNTMFFCVQLARSFEFDGNDQDQDQSQDEDDWINETNRKTI